jgi:hypothetical protein
LELQSQRHEQQRVAIHSTYPLMRAARLLEAVGSMRIADAEHVSSSGSRPWPCFDAGAWQQQQQQCGTGMLPLLKLPVDMTAAERDAAGSAAAAWLAEQARSQEMVAQLLERAQQAEIALAAETLAADGGQQKQQEQQLLLQSSANGELLKEISNSPEKHQQLLRLHLAFLFEIHCLRYTLLAGAKADNMGA